MIQGRCWFSKMLLPADTRSLQRFSSQLFRNTLQLFWTPPGGSEEISEPVYVTRPPESEEGSGPSQGRDTLKLYHPWIQVRLPLDVHGARKTWQAWTLPGPGAAMMVRSIASRSRGILSGGMERTRPRSPHGPMSPGESSAIACWLWSTRMFQRAVLQDSAPLCWKSCPMMRWWPGRSLRAIRDLAGGGSRELLNNA